MMSKKLDARNIIWLPVGGIVEEIVWLISNLYFISFIFQKALNETYTRCVCM